MDIYFIIFTIIAIVIFYFVTKTAVKNGIIEATKKEENETSKKEKLFINPFKKEHEEQENQ